MATAEHHDTSRPEEEQCQIPPHILAVDDNLSFVEMIGFVIGAKAASFHPVDDPKEVLRLLEEQKKRNEEGGSEGITYSVLLTDFEMPGLNGLELAKQAKELVPDLTIVLVTGLDAKAINFPSEEQRKAHGISAMLQKPFSYEALHQKLAQVRLMKEEIAPNL